MAIDPGFAEASIPARDGRGCPRHGSAHRRGPDGPVVGPARFATQYVTNWKGLVEQSHIAQIRAIEAHGRRQGGCHGV
jgi:hypothetical protein